MRLGITGSRDFGDLNLIWKMLTLIRSKLPDGEDLMIVSGAKTTDYRLNKNQVDAYALKWADDNNEPFLMFPPKWKKYGKIAGIKRNPKIVDDSEYTLSFWDKVSKGAKNTIDYATLEGKYLGNVDPDGSIELNELGKKVLGIK